MLAAAWLSGGNTAKTNVEGNAVALMMSCLSLAKSLNMPGLLISLLCEDIRMCARVLAHVCMWRPECMFWVISRVLFIILLRQHLSLARNLSNRLGSPASNSPALGITGASTPGFLWVLGIGFRSSWLRGGHCMIELSTQASL